jgi:histidinol-phosphate aminotransferase
VIGILGKPHANFLLVQIGNKEEVDRPDNFRSEKLYKYMAEQDKVVVRFRGKELGCEGCLRVTVGSREECERVVERLTAGLKRD